MMDNECENNNTKTYEADDSSIIELDEEKIIRITYTADLADENRQKISVWYMHFCGETKRMLSVTRKGRTWSISEWATYRTKFGSEKTHEKFRVLNVISQCDKKRVVEAT